jgi:hypothetical protein
LAAPPLPWRVPSCLARCVNASGPPLALAKGRTATQAACTRSSCCSTTGGIAMARRADQKVWKVERKLQRGRRGERGRVATRRRQNSPPAWRLPAGLPVPPAAPAFVAPAQVHAAYFYRVKARRSSSPLSGPALCPYSAPALRSSVSACCTARQSSRNAAATAGTQPEPPPPAAASPSWRPPCRWATPRS